MLAPNLARSSRAQRGISSSMLIERLRLNPDVLFARRFFGVVLLHPGLETLARRRVFPGERQTGNLGVSNLDSFSPVLRHHPHVALRQRGAVRAPVEHIAFHPLPIFQGDGQVSAIVKRLLQRFPNLPLARQGRHPSFEILVRKTESLIPRFWSSWHRQARHQAFGEVVICTSGPLRLGLGGALPVASGSSYLLNSVARTVARNPLSDPNVSFTALAS